MVTDAPMSSRLDCNRECLVDWKHALHEVPPEKQSEATGGFFGTCCSTALVSCIGY